LFNFINTKEEGKAEDVMGLWGLFILRMILLVSTANFFFSVTNKINIYTFFFLFLIE